MSHSSKFIVSTHIMVGLASRQLLAGRVISVKSSMLAESVNTNPVVIRRLLGMLRRADLIASASGPEGGSWLTRDPKKITLLDIYKAVEDGALFHLHYSVPNSACPIGENIQGALCETFEDAEKAMTERLATNKLSDIVEKVLKMAGVDEMMEKGMEFEEIEAHFMSQMAERQS